MGGTPGQADAATIQQQAAQHASDLFSIGSPGIKLALSDFLGDLGSPGQEPDSVKKAFSGMRDVTNTAFDQQEQASPLTIQQQMKQGGFRGDPNAGEYVAGQTLAQLEAARRGNMRNIDIQEVNQGLSQQDFDLQNIFGVAGAATGQSFGFTGNALQATGYNQRDPWGGALLGAAGGAATGAASGGWVGALVGGVAGGVGGYFGGH